MESYLVLFAVGVGVGILGGYLGIGGAVVITPVLLAISAADQIPESVRYPLVFSSTLLAITGTSISAGLTYAKAGRVSWPAFRVLAVSAVAFSFLGSTLAAHSSQELLRRVFALFALGNAAILISPLKGHDGGEYHFHVLPYVMLGAAAGFLSAFLGVAGGVLLVPFMLFLIKLPQKFAVGTSSMVGVVTSFVGALGYVINGWNVPDLPPGAIGYVYPAYALPILAGTLIGGPLGSKLNQGSSARLFRLLFAGYLIFIAVRMLMR
ncbi:MAG: sulfite exporter TauE/SafE family protein [Calditrichaeota bacterium]|nr:sulfite exporter TauE/SafE family protein [Calditrichota bacterium]MCB9365616.1 sulfite exporter TauE/SafE family protein [Calditrichota bacterium]